LATILTAAGGEAEERQVAGPDRTSRDGDAADFVRFAGVSVTYPTRDGPVRALDPVDLAFGRGDFVCIVGPSGCGKTTLLQVLAGFIAPSSGSVTVDGDAVTGPGPDRGVVFQQPALFPWMTVAQNAGFGPMVRGVGRAERQQKVDHLLGVVGLSEFANRYPYELSGGMQQRLAIARALVNDPRVLLMDEPFGALDALTREKMQEELHGVWRRSGTTIVFITHSVEEAVYLGTDVVVLSPRPGRIVEHVKVGFSRTPRERDDIRTIKASPDFVAVRERILRLIWAGEA
jgi:taurine transport system ATP-binding protein